MLLSPVDNILGVECLMTETWNHSIRKRLAYSSFIILCFNFSLFPNLNYWWFSTLIYTGLYHRKGRFRRQKFSSEKCKARSECKYMQTYLVPRSSKKSIHCWICVDNNMILYIIFSLLSQYWPRSLCWSCSWSWSAPHPAAAHPPSLLSTLAAN